MVNEKVNRRWRDFGGDVGRHCRDCTDRYPGCHDKCEKYLEAKQQHRDFTDMVFHNRIENLRLYRYRLERMIQEDKKKGR